VWLARPAVDRTILNSMADWQLFLLGVGGITVLALGGFLLMRRLLPHWRTDAASAVSAAVAAMVMTLFALVLAFAAVNLYQGYTDAGGNVANEANSLAQIARDVRVLPNAEEYRVQAAIVQYIHAVREGDFPAMRDGKTDPRGAVAIDALFASMQAIEPRTAAQQSFYDSAVSKLNDLVQQRRSRLSAADSTLPGAFVALLLLTAALTILVSYFLSSGHLGVELVLVGAVSVVVAAGLLTILLLEYPFSGSVSVSSDPYTQGVLGDLLAGRH
jgi:hypothetical protein